MVNGEVENKVLASDFYFHYSPFTISSSPVAESGIFFPFSGSLLSSPDSRNGPHGAGSRSLG
jgi:hypothetical protein